MDLDYLPNLQLAPFERGEDTVLGAHPFLPFDRDGLHLRVVFCVVLSMSLEIFHDVLDHRDKSDESEWNQDRWLASSDRDVRNCLENGHDYEIDIGHLGQLIIEVLGEEAETGVSGSADGVALEHLLPLLIEVLRVDEEVPESHFSDY